MLLTERVGVSEDVRPIHLVVEQVEAVGRFLLGLGVQRLLESLELRWSYSISLCRLGAPPPSGNKDVTRAGRVAAHDDDGRSFHMS
jgi:hypothetical protein